MSKFNPLAKRRSSQSTPSLPPSPSFPSAMGPPPALTSDPTIRPGSSPLNPRSSPNSSPANKPLPLPPSGDNPPQSQIQSTGSTGMIASTSSFLQRANPLSRRDRSGSPRTSYSNGNNNNTPPAPESHSLPPTPLLPPTTLPLPIPNANSNPSSITLVPQTPPKPTVRKPPSHSRSRSRSQSRPSSAHLTSSTPFDFAGKDKDRDKEGPSQSKALGLQGWWDKTELIPRPWKDHGGAGADIVGGRQGQGQIVLKRRDTGVSLKAPRREQEEGWDITRQSVIKALQSILGTSLSIAHETLVLSVDLLDLAPVPGLRPLAITLLNVWDCLQKVDMNRMACLRLTQRCADILISVKEEVTEAGGQVGRELEGPIGRLVESFDMVYKFLLKQTDRPFLKRYLKRDEILRQISACDVSLSDSVSAFSISIQIRILKQVQAIQVPSQIIYAPGSPDPYVQYPPLALPAPPSSPSFPSLSPTPSSSTTPTLAEIRARLHELHTHQNAVDATLDLVDLRQLMRAALQTSSDAQMIEVLQVGRQEMPEAIKALQRALEREVEREGSGSSGIVEAAVGVGVAERETRRASVPVTSTAGLKTIVGGITERRMTLANEGSGSVTTDSGSGSGSGTGSEGMKVKDTLDREFIESGIDALRRVSNGPDVSLPSWTITKFEVDLDEKIGKIGIGYFSNVYKGTWRKRVVALKVLAPTTPRELFQHEIAIWKGLNHPNVLVLYGASSAYGEPPWFFVSPYCANGSLVGWLKTMRSGASTGGALELESGLNFGKGWEVDVDLMRCMHQVSKGMEYLHRKGVLHGDLKAANVLVDINKRCLVSDFGQSEMRSEAYRLSGMVSHHGTLRWQAPELMGGGYNRMTQEMDVYAFAICCVEILDGGTMPWQHQDDAAVIRFVLEENKRPQLPPTRFATSAVVSLIHACWNRDPTMRPSFKRIAAELKQMRVKSGANVEEIESPRPTLDAWPETPVRPRHSPDMRPIGLPISGLPPVLEPGFAFPSSSSSDGSFQTAPNDLVPSPAKAPVLSPIRVPETFKKPEPVLYTPSLNSSRASSIFASSGSSSLSDILEDVVPNFDGYESPPPADDRLASIRNERRYRLLLKHEFHPSLTLPLWAPTIVPLGAVGYLDKPSGMFVTLFTAFDPGKTSGGFIDLPTLHGYGRVTRGELRQDKRNVALRGLDALSGLLTFKSYSQNVSRRYSYPLRDGHKVAYMCTESTKYQYIEDLEAPKKWFKSNVDKIMQVFGPQHHFQKEELYLVIGTLSAQDYALFVSHKHPSGQVHFNVWSAPRTGQDWGTFTTDTELPPELSGPSYHEQIPGNCMSASKVSIVGSGGSINWNALLLARLRFKPDVADPTSL